MPSIAGATLSRFPTMDRNAVEDDAPSAKRLSFHISRRLARHSNNNCLVLWVWLADVYSRRMQISWLRPIRQAAENLVHLPKATIVARVRCNRGSGFWHRCLNILRRRWLWPIRAFPNSWDRTAIACTSPNEHTSDAHAVACEQHIEGIEDQP
jgi:hypothetical protein